MLFLIDYVEREPMRSISDKPKEKHVRSFIFGNQLAFVFGNTTPNDHKHD